MPGYNVKHETLVLGTSDFMIRSLLDRQQFADPEGLAEALGISSASWPLFCLLWAITFSPGKPGAKCAPRHEIPNRHLGLR